MAVTTLLISPYPPARDGLAAYALQLAVKLRASGEAVDVLSPTPSGARYHANFLSFAGRMKLLRLARRYDRVLVQYHPFFFFGASSKPGHLADILGLLALFRAGPPVEVYVHEVDYGAGRRRRLAPLWRRVWRAPARIHVHTARERDDMIEAFSLRPDRVHLVAHGESFVPRAQLTRVQARRVLGVEEDAFIFLCIGFIQGHKGFDRAVRAFAALEGQHRAHLYVVGSLRVPSPEHSAYLETLRALISATPRAHLRESFVSDVNFDRWILASDVVVLPYREIWSSGVIERAAILDRPAIVTDVGGLAHQAREDTVVVQDELGLIAAMASSCGAQLPPGRIDELPTTHAQAARWVADRGHRMWLWNDPMAGIAAASGPRPDRARVIEPLPFPLEPHATGLKRIVLRNVSRLTRWQLMPVVAYINRMRDIVLQDRHSDEPAEQPRSN